MTSMDLRRCHSRSREHRQSLTDTAGLVPDRLTMTYQSVAYYRNKDTMIDDEQHKLNNTTSDARKMFLVDQIGEPEIKLNWTSSMQYTKHNTEKLWIEWPRGTNRDSFSFLCVRLASLGRLLVKRVAHHETTRICLQVVKSKATKLLWLVSSNTVQLSVKDTHDCSLSQFSCWLVSVHSAFTEEKRWLMPRDTAYPQI